MLLLKLFKKELATSRNVALHVAMKVGLYHNLIKGSQRIVSEDPTSRELEGEAVFWKTALQGFTDFLFHKRRTAQYETN